MNRERLFGRLGTTAYEAVVEATALCRNGQQEFIEIEHWLVCILHREQSDIAELLSHYQADASIVLEHLQRYLKRLPRRQGNNIDISSRLETAIERALATSQLVAQAPHIRSGHILLALIENDQMRRSLYQVSNQFERIQWPQAANVLEQTGRGWREFNERPVDAPDMPIPVGMDADTADADALTRWATNFTELARKGELDPVIGRDNELRQVIDILLRRRQNNPILVGEAGVGKTAVVEGLAQRIADGSVPAMLADAQVWALDIARLQAGASMKGEFEARLKSVIDAIEQSKTPIILFADEAHTLVGAGGQTGTGDAVNMLKPMLARGKLRMVAATTWSEYKQYIEQDAALTRRMQPVVVDEPNEASAISMMRMVAPRFAEHHGVRITDEALVAAVKLSKRHLPSRQLPDKSISLLDTACARVAMSQIAPPAALEMEKQAVRALDLQLQWITQDQAMSIDSGADKEALTAKRDEHQGRVASLAEQVAQARDIVRLMDERIGKPAEGDEADMEALSLQLRGVQSGKPMVQPWVDARTIAAVLSEWTGIPDDDMVSDDLDAAINLSERLNARIFGQTNAIAVLSKALQVAKAGIHEPDRPLGVFMLTGPTGTGKTETAIALAEILFGGSHNLIQFNMNEFQEAHTAATLKGAPPGYVGYGKGGVLTEAVRRKPYSVVLLDEFDKAHRDVHEVFYQVFDRGWMEDGEGRRISFRNCLILMTSNVGGEEIEAAALAEQPASYGQQLQLARQLLGRHFPPPLLARMQVLPFYPLGIQALQQIAARHLAKLASRLNEQGIELEIDATAPAWLAETVGAHPNRGRAVEELVRSSILPSLAQELLAARRHGQPLTLVRVVGNDGLALEFPDKEADFNESPIHPESARQEIVADDTGTQEASSCV